LFAIKNILHLERGKIATSIMLHLLQMEAQKTDNFLQIRKKPKTEKILDGEMRKIFLQTFEKLKDVVNPN